jgi:acetolactate synthase-1/2/3 large subunit
MRTGWRNAWDAARTRVIDITPESNTHYMHQSSLPLVADIPATLAALAVAPQPATLWSGGEIPNTQTALAQAFPRSDDWGPAGVIAQCIESLPADTLLTADSGAHRILLSQMWPCTEPRQLVQSSGLCTMGCALPLAMGRKLGDPDRTVVSFSGDAGFLMVAGELATAAEMGLAPIFIVFVDASLALIDLKQRQRQLPNAGVDFGRHDFAAIGRAFGGEGHTVRNRKELKAALDLAVKAETFTVIAAEIDKEAYDGRI